MPQRKRLLVFITVGLLTVAVGFIPDLVSDELKAWCLQRLGPSYPWYFIGLFVVACFILLALTGEFKDLLSFNRQAKTKEQIKIAWSQSAKEKLKSAREKLHKAALEESIKMLSQLKNASVEEELSLLSVRLAQHRQNSRLGTLSSEQQEIAFNRISKDVLSLIKAIENQLAEGEKENRQLRDAFRQRYRERLAKKLASRQPVNLRRFATTEGTSEQVAATFIPYNGEEIREEIGKTFQEAHGRLLIVGEKGMGKTTLLLQLADRLFDLEEDSLPVVLNLATWQSRFGKLETWLETVLASELSTNKAGAKAVLRQANLILLLDGLDELKEDEAINSCLAAIADFGAVAGRRFVITCRIEEYKRAQEDARVNLQIEVGSLKSDQIEAELTRMGREQPEALPLLQAIQKDPLLWKAVETPFYFNTLQLLFAGRLPVFTSTDLENREAEITQKFVAAALQNTQNKAYPLESAGHWLAFLASRMNERNMVVFELRDLQYDWCRGWSLWVLVSTYVIYGLVKSLIFGISCAILFGFLGIAKGAIILGIGGGLLIGLALGLGFGTGFALDMKFALNIIFLLLLARLTELGGDLGVVLTYAIGIGVCWGLFSRPPIEKSEVLLPEISTHELVDWSSKAFLKFLKKYYGVLIIIGLGSGLGIGLVDGYQIGLILGLGFTIVLGLSFMILDESKDIVLIKFPYQRFQASMKLLYFSILQHFHLRYLLSQKKLLPLDLVDFLNEMADRNLLEPDGATWRFRHSIIQDHFSDLWKEEAGQKEEKA